MVEGADNEQSRQQSETDSNPEFLATLNAAAEISMKERMSHFNFSERINTLKQQAEALDSFTTNEELNWLFEHLNKRSAKDVLIRLAELDKNLAEIKVNQQEILRQMQQPVTNDPTISKRELARVLSEHVQLASDVDALKVTTDTLKASKGVDEDLVRTVGSLQNLFYEVKALSSSVESLRNTFAVMHKQMQLMNGENRLTMMEQKMKEVVEYLQNMRGTLEQLTKKFYPPQVQIPQ